MIMHSDNTGTDMSIKQAEPEKVREFVASAGLKNTMIPESTRAFFGYLLGAKDYKSFSWAGNWSCGECFDREFANE